MSEITGKVVIEAIPKDEDSKKKLVAFLLRYSRSATQESIASLLSQLPVILIRQIASDKGQAIASKLQQIGAKARFIPFSQPRAETPSVSSKSVSSEIRQPASSNRFFKTAAIIALSVCVGIGLYMFYNSNLLQSKGYTIIDPNGKLKTDLYENSNFNAIETHIAYLYDKENFVKMYDLYLLYQALGKIDTQDNIGQMEKILNDWCAKRAESHIPFLVRGCFRISQKQFESAQQDLEKARELNPDDPNPLCFLIALAREWNLPGETMEKYFDQAVSAYPNHFGSYFEKFDYLKPTRHGSSKEMFGFAEKAASVDEPMMSVLIVLAYEEDQKNSSTVNIMGKKDVWPLIKKIYEKLLNTYPENIRINPCYAYHSSMAQIYDISADRFDLIGDRWIADACFDSADSYNRTRAYVYMKRGEMLLLDSEQNETATEYFLKSLEYLPSADGYYGLSTAYWQAGVLKQDKSLLKKAEAAMRKALEMNPNHEAAKQQIFQLRRAIGI